MHQRPDEVRALDGLAHIHRVLGRAGPARDHWQQALRILGSLGIEAADDVDAADIRTQLAALNRPDLGC